MEDPSITEQTLELSIREIGEILKPYLKPRESDNQEQTPTPLITLSPIFSLCSRLIIDPKTGRFIGGGRNETRKAAD